MKAALGLALTCLLALGCAGSPKTPEIEAADGEVVLLDLSWLLPKNAHGVRVVADVEFLIDGKRVWSGRYPPTPVHPEVLALPVRRLSAGHHRFRLVVGGKSWNSEVTLEEGYVGVVHLHCSTGTGDVKSRLWEDSGGYE
ncbi:MAG: hypothetical protein ACYTG4_08065 [Planctomycetota bacterium]